VLEVGIGEVNTFHADAKLRRASRQRKVDSPRDGISARAICVWRLGQGASYVMEDVGETWPDDLKLVHSGCQ
jgi:hypothetical protein